MPQREPSGPGCIGVPGMIGLLAFLAFALTVPGTGVLIGAGAVVVVYLVMGLALTQTRKRDDR